MASAAMKRGRNDPAPMPPPIIVKKVIEAARSGIAHSNQPAFADVFDGMRGR